MDNFDLKKYLVENKVTTNSRMMREEGKNSMELDDLLNSIPHYTEEYFRNKQLEDYLDTDEEGVALNILDTLGKEDAPVYKKFPTGEEMGAENYLYYNLGDGYVLGTDDYTYSFPDL